jgi:hypothetical protein
MPVLKPMHLRPKKALALPKAPNIVKMTKRGSKRVKRPTLTKIELTEKENPKKEKRMQNNFLERRKLRRS